MSSDDPTVPPPRPMAERPEQVRVIDRLCGVVLDLVEVSKKRLKLDEGLSSRVDRRLDTIAGDVASMRADQALYLPAAHLDTVQTKEAALAAAKAARRTESDTAAFRKQQAERDVGKLHFAAQILESLRKMDLAAKVFVVVVIALLIGGAHYLYPILHPVAQGALK